MKLALFCILFVFLAGGHLLAAPQGGETPWTFIHRFGFEPNEPSISMDTYEGSPVMWIDTEIAHSGTRSLALRSDAQSRGAANVPARLKGGGNYRVTFYYKTDDKIKPGAAKVRLCFMASGGVRLPWTKDNNYVVDASEWGTVSIGGNLATVSLEPSPDKWTRLSVVISSPAEDTTLMVNPVNFFGEGTVWFDDLEIVSPPYN